VGATGKGGFNSPLRSARFASRLSVGSLFGYGRVDFKENTVTKIYYFSGTGNTLWSAKRIAEMIGGDYELINIGTAAYSGEASAAADVLVLLFPSYAYGMPVIVRRFLQKIDMQAQYIAVLVTYGTHPGGPLAGAARILKKKKIMTTYFGCIPAVENYLPVFGSPRNETIQKRTEMQMKATEEAADRIRMRQVNSINIFRPVSAFVSLLFSLGVKIFYKYYRVNKDCNGCGVCAKMCPVNAIIMKESRPVFSGKCEHCIGCIHWCPQRAIGFWRIRPDTPRYHHPAISVSDMTSARDEASPPRR
jgi:ferredoxin